MPEVTVSVLMTAFNREKYIAEAIESVLAQDFTDWELVVCDDCSTDSTVEIIRRYAAADPRIRLFVNPKNLGDYPNRNEVARHARGRYLKYLDSDDKLLPDCLSMMVSCMEKFPEAGHGLDMWARFSKPEPYMLTPEDTYRFHYVERKGIFSRAPLCSIIRRDVFEAEGGFALLQHVGDFEFWHRLSWKYNLVVMPGGHIWYREHDEQQMSDNRRDLAVLAKYNILARQFLSDERTPLSADEKQRQIRRQEAYLAGLVLAELFRNRSLKKADAIRKAAQLSWLRTILLKAGLWGR